MSSYKLKEEFIRLSADQRYHQLDIPIIALTGGIATGKSTIRKIFERKGFATLCADEIVKEVYREEETIRKIKELCPEALQNNKIDFKKLRSQFFSNSELQNKIENFIYQKMPHIFNLNLKKIKDPKLLIYDIPLLFEKKLENKFDINILAYTPKDLQIKRLVERDHISLELAQEILQKQIPIEEKKEKAEHIIENSKCREDLEVQVSQLIEKLLTTTTSSS